MKKKRERIETEMAGECIEVKEKKRRQIKRTDICRGRDQGPRRAAEPRSK
jgi:hypothetical protein